MKEQARDVVHIGVLAVGLILALLVLFVWNQKSGVLDPLAARTYSMLVSQ